MQYLSPQQILSIKKVDFQRGIFKTITMHIQSIVQIFSISLRSPAFYRRAHFAFLPALLPLRQAQGRAHRENGCAHPFCVYWVRFLFPGGLLAQRWACAFPRGGNLWFCSDRKTNNPNPSLIEKRLKSIYTNYQVNSKFCVNRVYECKQSRIYPECQLGNPADALSRA